MFKRRWLAAKNAFTRLVVVSSRFSFSLCVGFWCGIVAVCVDLDHLTMLWGHPHGRVAHTPVFILACAVFLYYGARLGGLLIGLVLRKIREGRQK